MHVRTAHKLLKRFSRYDQKIFMNVVTGDESWIHYFEPHRKIRKRVWLTKMQEGLGQVCCLIVSILIFAPLLTLYCHIDHKDYQYKKGYVCHIFTTKGLVIKVLIPKDKPTNARFYKKNVWRKLSNSTKNVDQRRVSVLFLSHDNALSHKAGSMTSFLKEQGDYFLEHLPFSPDITPCDFFSLHSSQEKSCWQKIYLP